MNQQVKIVSKMNNKVMTVSQGQYQTRPGDLIIESYTGSPFQKFIVFPMGQYFGIQCANDTNRYIDVPGESSKIYEELIVYNYNGNLNQKWVLEGNDQQGYLFKSAFNGLVAEVQGGIDAEGMAVVQNKNYKNLSQYWKIEKV